jgi:hypothetical protein
MGYAYRSSTGGNGSILRFLNELGANSAAWMAVLLAAVYGVVVSVFHWLPVNDALVFVLLLWGTFALLERCSVRARTIAIYVVTEIFLLSWILDLWTVGFGGRNMIFGGILPWSDAGGYYDGAVRLSHGVPMMWAAKRNVFPSALAVVLKLFDGSIRAALLTYTLFAGVVIAFAAIELWRTHGRYVALFVYAMLLFSERIWAGYVQTEHIGLPFGIIGFILVWRAVSASDKDGATARWLTLAGIFSITIALMARVGAFFVLPALALWGAFNLFPATTAWRARAMFLGLAVLAMGAGGLVHTSIHYIATTGATFSDYPLILYGLIYHRDWDYIFQVYPQLGAMPLGDNEATRMAWAIVFRDAMAQPLVVLEGFVRSFVELFVSREGLFGFVWRNYDDILLENGAALRASMAEHGVAGPVLLWFGTFGLYSVANAIAMFLLSVAFLIATPFSIVALYRRPVDGYGRLIRYTVAGILVSAFFTPPWITPASRIAVATLSFLACAPALMLFRSAPQAVVPPHGKRLAYVPVVFAVVLLSGVAYLRLFSPPLPVCEAGQQHVVELYPETAVDVVSASVFDLHKKAAGTLSYSIRFIKRHEQRWAQSLAPYIRPGTRYISAFDACDGETKILIDDAHVLDPNRGGFQAINAQPLAERNVMHVVSMAGPAGNLPAAPSAVE